MKKHILLPLIKTIIIIYTLLFFAFAGCMPRDRIVTSIEQFDPGTQTLTPPGAVEVILPTLATSPNPDPKEYLPIVTNQITLTPTVHSASTTLFPIGPGGADVIPHQIVRVSGDRLYIFGYKGDSSTQLNAYWTKSSGLPNAGQDFSGKLQITENANIISVEVIYDGNQIIHVLTNLVNGQIKDHPLDINVNQFKPVINFVTNGGTITGNPYIGTSGLSGMMDLNGNLNIAYWSSSNHIIYASYKYNPSTNGLTVIDQPIQLDSAGSANHPVLAVSPKDNSVTVAWVSEDTTPTRILAKTRTSSGWGSGQVLSTAPVWTSRDFGINVDQGPSLIISSDGTRNLTYIENWRTGTPNNYGRIHYVTTNGATWVDKDLGYYSHDPTLAINAAGNIYIIGHGLPENIGTPCISNLDMCFMYNNSGGLWNKPQILLTHTGKQSFDSSPSAKWSVVGFNRPEVIEFLFAEVGIGGYTNSILYYGRIN